MTLAAFDRLPDDERAYWIAEWELERLTCPDCGNPIAECSDPERVWFSDRRVCYAAMERESASAAYAALHEDKPWHDGSFKSWAKERSASHPIKFDMGVSIGVDSVDRAPWDKFTTRRNASPIEPSPEVVDGRFEDVPTGPNHDDERA